MKRMLMLPAASILIAFGSTPARAWDGPGHKLVARIAWDGMTPPARARAIQILQGAAMNTGLLDGFGTGVLSPQQQVRLFLRAATWPDDVRPDDPRAPRYHIRDRHFTDLFWRQDTDFSDVLPSNLPEHGDLLRDVPQLRADLTGVDRRKAAVALAWLIHLVGDIHQPLHASGRQTLREPNGDEGGNLYKLERLSNGERANLHSLWDHIVSDNVRPHSGETESAFMARAAHEIAQRHPRNEFAAETGQTDFRQWAQASVLIAQQSVYRPPLRRFVRANTTYRAAAFAAAEPRVALAGYRLADLLNQALG